MAASATSLSTTSSLSLSLRRTPRFSLLPQPHSLSYPLKPPRLSLKFSPLRASPTDLNDPDAQYDESDDVKTELISDPDELFDYDEAKYGEPPEPVQRFGSTPSFDDFPPESEEEIAIGYEELYGPAYSGESYLGNDVNAVGGGEDSDDEDEDWRNEVEDEDEEFAEKVLDGYEEEVVQVRRVTKVVKGGKQLNFRVVMVVGDLRGNVGVGVGKATEIVGAVKKAGIDARRHIVRVPLTKYSTFPHRADGKFGAAKVMLRPAVPGSGVTAGGAVRTVLEMAGVQNALGKQLGSNNTLNNARATIVAFQQMRQFSEIAALRGIPMEELWK
ncbi:hypothetical protein C3L33_15533, partial [Rhododendron williamsianum]